MKKPIPSVIVILALVFLIVSPTVDLVDVAKANFLPVPAILIYSPLIGRTYQNTSIPLDVEVNVLTGDPDIRYVRYNLDGARAHMLLLPV